MGSLQKLIFAVTIHEVLGAIIEPFVVSVHDDGQFFYGLRKVNQTNVSEFIPDLLPHMKKVVEVCDEYREEILVKQFSKKRVVPKVFYKELPEERLKTIIRPWIEKRISLCLDLLRESGTPVYFKGKRKDILLETEISIKKCNAHIILNFEKLENETHYYITPVCEDKDLILFGENSMLITRTPCYAMLDNAIYKFHDNFDGNKLLPFFRKEYIIIPRKNEKEFFKTFVTGAVLDHEIRYSGFEIQIKAEKCTPVLKFESSLEGFPVLALFYKYGEKSIPCNFPDSKIVSLFGEDSYGLKVIERNQKEEKEYSDLLLSMGLKNNLGNFFQLNRKDEEKNPEYALLGWVNENYENFKSQGIEFVNKAKYFYGKTELEVKIDEQNDWFDVKAFAHFGEFRVPFIQLKKHLLNHIREYTLPNGEIAILPEEWFAKFRETLLLGNKEGDAIRLKKHQFALIEKIETHDEQKFQKVFDKLKMKKLRSNLTLPAGLNATLRPYQEKGFSWLYFLYKNNFGGCLADDMGLGKTIQVLTLLLKIKEEARSVVAQSDLSNFQLNLFGGKGENLPPPHTSLIVMPLSLVHNWESEIRKFAPSLRYFKQTGTNRIQYKNGFYNYDVILTTYGIIRNDFDLLKEVQFSHIILDESQFIKNPESKAFHAIKSLNSQHRIVLTGTPVENSLTDLWSQLSFLNPGLLGGLSYFKNEFVAPIEKQNVEIKKEHLKELIEPFILRRTKSVVAKELPDLIEKVHYCEMSPEQKSLYESKKSEIRNRIFENMERLNQPGIKIEILQGLMQLRLMANHPELTSTGAGMESGKFNEVIRNVENLMAEGHKVLIFSQFVKHLNIFRNWFDQNQMSYSYLTGELNDQARKKVIREFQSQKENRLFLISLRAGGVGLNLTSADYVFILDPWWNPAVEKQAINRAHRIGQTKNVISYKFITKDSVEEKILLLQQKKEKLADDFVNSNNPFRVFSDKEMLNLFE
jgi:SNF2 family DNA or RNA helicase